MYLSLESKYSVSDGGQIFSSDELLQHFIKVTMRR